MSWSASRETCASLRGILASPCHRAPFPELVAGASPPTIACPVCGRRFVKSGAAYDLRLSESATSVAASFEHQWRRYDRGDFERTTLYGADPQADLESFLSAFGCGPEALRGRWVLDAGCGSGRLAQTLGALGANVVGLDLTSSVIAAAARNLLPNVHYLRADLMRPPFAAQSFDFVWSIGVLHHTGAADRGFRQLAGLVAPGGRLAVWLYSARRPSPFLAIRRLLPFAPCLREERAMALCRALALPIYLAGWMAPMVGRKRLALATIRFGLYDSLTPRYQSRHTAEEVSGWFREAGFSGLRLWSEVGVSGVRG